MSAGTVPPPCRPRLTLQQAHLQLYTTSLVLDFTLPVASTLMLFLSLNHSPPPPDDPVSAVALHMACGVWALLFTGLLAKPQYVRDVYGSHGFGPNVLNSRK